MDECERIETKIVNLVEEYLVVRSRIGKSKESRRGNMVVLEYFRNYESGALLAGFVGCFGRGVLIPSGGRGTIHFKYLDAVPFMYCTE